MRTFCVADLSPQGELRQMMDYDYATLERVPGAIDLIARCSAELWKTPEEAEIRVTDEPAAANIRWRATAATSGIATVRRNQGELVSVSVLTAGYDPQTDAATIDVLQKHLLRELRGTPYEPAFDLLSLKQRPLLATITFASGGEPAEQIVNALADRCFAAAYFRYLGLA
jgi:hypothetical protein